MSLRTAQTLHAFWSGLEIGLFCYFLDHFWSGLEISLLCYFMNNFLSVLPISDNVDFGCVLVCLPDCCALLSQTASMPSVPSYKVN